MSKTETKTERLNLRLAKSVKAKAVKLAAKDKRSVNDFITQLILKAK